MGYNATSYWSGPTRDFWFAILIASAASGGAGLARLFRSKRDEAPGSQSHYN
jgi:hypothetical protein